MALGRAQHFADLRKRREESDVFRKLIPLLDVDDEHLRSVSWAEKIVFISYYKDVALLVKSGLMREEVAFQLFGNHAARCWNSDHFWDGINRGSVYIELFKEFAERMLELEKIWESGERLDRCIL